MRKSSALIFLGISVFGFTGCALLGLTSSASNSGSMISNPETYKKQLDAWVGKDINNLLLAWGPPSSVFNMPNGDVMYTWLIEDNKVVSEGSGSANNFSDSVFARGWSVQQEVRNSCRTSFIATKNKIVNFSFKGNMCVASEPTEDLFASTKGQTVRLILDGGREVTGILNSVDNEWVNIGTGIQSETIHLKAVLKVEKVK